MLTSLLLLSLTTCLQDPAPVAAWEAPGVEPAPAAWAVHTNPAPYVGPQAPQRRSRFAFAVLPNVTFGIDDIPSGSGSVFFGGRLRGDEWALGVQFTGTLGVVERGRVVPLAHHHHFTAVKHFKRRGFATVGGGAGVYFFQPPVMEFEAKLGVRFGPRRRAVVGAMARLGLDFFYRERLPLPQVGLFIGFSLL